VISGSGVSVDGRGVAVNAAASAVWVCATMVIASSSGLYSSGDVDDGKVHADNTKVKMVTIRNVFFID